jgi:hypothetical protein
MRATLKQIPMQLTGSAHLHKDATKDHLAPRDRGLAGFGAR